MSSLTFSVEGVVEPLKRTPTAVVSASPAFGVIGSVVKLTGTSSSDPDGLPLQYMWQFLNVPIGSKAVQEGFRSISEDDSEVSFSPDVVGEYSVRLTVSNGTVEATTDQRISIRAILVPDGRGLVPDGKFIWSYIRDVWQEVENREIFETLWSALIQISAGELLKLYQNDFAKSIRDIQDLYQRRWLKYTPRLELGEDLSFILGSQAAGIDATTESRGQSGKAIILGPTEVSVVQGLVLPTVSGKIEIISSQNPDNVGKYRLAVSPTKTGYRLLDPIPEPLADKIGSNIRFEFNIQSTIWSLYGARSRPYAELMSKSPSPIDELSEIFGQNTSSSGPVDIRIGDTIHYPTGPNAGFYRVVSGDGSTYEVAPAPPAASDPNILANVYRPVPYKVNAITTDVTDAFAVEYTPGTNDVSGAAAGRILVLGDTAHTLLRSFVDESQDPPLVIVTTDKKSVLPGLSGQSWRLPNTLISDSMNFTTEGVCTGDVLLLDIVNERSQAISEIKAQVVGVDDDRLGFVVTTESLDDGAVPLIPNDVYLQVSNDLGIPSIEDVNGSLFISQDAKKLTDVLQSTPFRQKYWNTKLPIDTWFEIAGGRFQVRPRAIIRNRNIPIDESVRSIPLLQEWIVQPTTIEKGGQVYQQTRDGDFLLKNAPVALVENSDFVITGQTAFSGQVTFQTGSNNVVIEGGSFIDRGLLPGDIFSIEQPVTLKADYTIVEVLSNDTLRLNIPVPYYRAGIVTARVSIKRSNPGTFIRIVPGGFTPKNPVPESLWSEVTFFDNSDTIESNFGILVGLTRDDLEKVSTSINYRQAVSGLMFAYTRGSAVSKLRLGAQILLGLPFAEHRGIIRSVEGDYRLDDNGEPIQGRLLVEDIDPNNNALGVYRSYTYPLDAFSELAGLETSPSTDKPYTVGDIVETFAALSKGAEVVDYLTAAAGSIPSATRMIQQFHSLQLRVNDNIFKLEELDLVSSFLRRITPSYVAFFLLSTTEVQDKISISDYARFSISKPGSPFLDDVSMGIATPLTFDAQSPNGSLPLIYWNGDVYEIRKFGRDLTTVGHSSTVLVQSGHLVTPVSGEAPLARIGDTLFLTSGPNYGLYPITSITETTAALSGTPSLGLEDGSGITYVILRKVSHLLRTGVGSGTSGLDLFTVEPGLVTDGVMPGDWLVVQEASGVVRYLIIDVPKTSGSFSTLRTLPALKSTTSSVPYWVVRPNLIPAGVAAGVLTSDGSKYTAWASSPTNALVESNDELLLLDAHGDPYVRVTAVDPLGQVFIPPVRPGTYQTQLFKSWKLQAGINFNRDIFPWDETVATLTETTNTAACTNGSSVVGLGNGYTNPRAGDLLQLVTTANSSVDHGYGPGVYPIIAKNPSAKTVTLAYNLTASGSASFKIIRTVRPR